ncbi:MAG: PASTA domain-containing protein [Bacteroidales bacterium]|nr:PASTA domain-containing protein [Bacteroidales bacterium]
MVLKKKKGWLYFVVNLLVMGVLALVIIFFTLKGIDRYTKHGEAVSIPKVEGMSVQKAESLFATNGLHYEISDSIYLKDKLGGVILDCIPPTGSKVKEGRIIYVTVNRFNAPLIQVPDVADNSSSRQARVRVLAAGFKLTEDELIPGERDWVYAVKYKGIELGIGEKVPFEALLTLVVGNGEEEVIEDSLSVDEWIEDESMPINEESWFE